MSKRKNFFEKEVKWGDICRAAWMLGLVEKDTKAEWLRLSKRLAASKTAVKAGRGRYCANRA